ncbi:MAG TPA: helix-turn-helix domain-containing protein [Pilimelia sp.]|nr:helix-turn-helix domain-containing protein [Pilimelia sp.]
MAADHGDERITAEFGALLRDLRRAAGLTQADLADLAGIGVRTVRDLERGRASRPQRATVELLAGALGLVGAERADFHAVARGQPGPRAERPAAGGPVGIQLPPPTALVGRDRDILEVADALSGAGGPVSLVGLAGVGKSTLAVAVAHHLAGRYPGGVAGVPTSDCGAEEDVLASVASVFGVARPADLATRFADAPGLVLVDAVERAPAAVADALRWLADAVPLLRVLATGRHPVGVVDELVWPVAPLDVPPGDGGLDLAAAARYPAVELFLTRLREVRQTPPDPHEVDALVRLVRRLGGLPLALELAAARGRVLDLNEILHRYGDRVLDLGQPESPAPRPAVPVTLRDAVAASYRLLEPAEQYALRRLSVFRHRWSVELAEALLTDSDDPTGGPLGGDPAPVLDRLVELGLVSARGAGPARFRLLDVVRDYAAEQATLTGESAAARRRHAQVMAGLAARTEPLLVGPQIAASAFRLDEVAGDLWAALAHAANDDPPTALFLASKLPRWWRFRGRDVPGRQWLRRLLDDPRTADVDPAVRAWARVGVAQLALEHGAAQQELPTTLAALDDFQRLGDVTGELAARSVLCALYMSVGGHDDARRHGEAALALANRTGRVRDVIVAQNNLTWHEIRAGNLTAARRRLATVDRLAAQLGDERLRVLAGANLAEVARLQGRYAEAEMLGRRAVARLEELGDPGHRRRVLGTVGLALAQDGRLAEAAGVLAELRSVENAPEGDGERGRAAQDGPVAAIEATLALGRGDRDLAAEWFTVAARAFAGGHDLRDVAEALVGATATTDDPEIRGELLGWLRVVCREGGIRLLPRELELLQASGGCPDVPRRRAAADDRAAPDPAD